MAAFIFIGKIKGVWFRSCQVRKSGPKWDGLLGAT